MAGPRQTRRCRPRVSRDSTSGRPAMLGRPRPDRRPARPFPAPQAETRSWPTGTRRVESEFNVWQRPGPVAVPDAGPVAVPEVGPADPDPGRDEWVLPDAGLVAMPNGGPADPDPDPTPDPDRDEWVLPDADLLPAAELGPVTGWPPSAAELLAELAGPMAEPLDLGYHQVDEEPIRRQAAPRRTSPAPGWNPDSEEDWLRVLRGLPARKTASAAE